MLYIKNLTKQFGIRSGNQVNFQVNKGRNIWSPGENGAGKTTTLRMLATMLKPSSVQPLWQAMIWLRSRTG